MAHHGPPWRLSQGAPHGGTFRSPGDSYADLQQTMLLLKHRPRGVILGGFSTGGLVTYISDEVNGAFIAKVTYTSAIYIHLLFR